MRALYTVLFRLALPLILVRLLLRGRREPGYRQAVSERFGVYRGEKPAKLVWVHAVSVGEARAAEPLVRGIMARLPDHRILVTCTTAAGRETLKQVYGDSILSAYLPYDYPEAVQAFLAHFAPRLGVLMETEVWPNLLAGCAAKGVPVVLANARLSEKSARGYLRWRSLAEPAFGSLALVCAQSEADAARLRSVGARRVEVTGNLKFDVGPDPEQLAAGRAWRAALGRPVLLLASTREGEEILLLKEISSNKDLLVLVVPRHPQRFGEVAPLAQGRRTRDPAPAPAHRVYLGDTMGEMPFYYAACDVAIIGGSFAPLGGQNLIEALAAGAPVVVGPHMFNFVEATRLALEARAAIQAADAASAVKRALELLHDARERRHMSEAGRKLCQAHRGATGRHLALLAEVLAATAPARG
ncbi:MAG: 3-deoxy-D-manno-octulosonic-acid transferase [Betaproteobacteria bacterium]|nr:3-deoxy-D-manno-octulosonic-acid transferase [Betaproteobacteria bacterium]